MLNVADIGAGSGYFTLPLGTRAAPGKVYAVDPSTELLGVIRASWQSDGAPANVELLVGEDGDRTGGGCVRPDFSLRRVA